MKPATFDFDAIPDRRRSDSGKWNTYGPDVLPMWVADMDFAAPPAVVEALQRRVAEGIFGYASHFPGLNEALIERMERLYNWRVTPEEIILLPGIVSGLNIAAAAVGSAGDGVLVNTPVYGPFLSAPTNQGRTVVNVPQVEQTQPDGTLDYAVDFDALEAAIDGRTRLFLFCNPHNPTGRVWSRAEIERFAALAERHDLIICSDEIHCDLLLGNAQHTPTAALDPAIAARTVTLMAPSKTFNVPGLGAGFAIVQDRALRERVRRAMQGMVPHVNVLGTVAMQAAYTGGDTWLEQLRAYLTANRDYLVDFLREQVPGVRTTRPQATYLAWLDCRDLGLEVSPYQFFLEQAQVALGDGIWFGAEGKGFVRLNFGCPRATLTEGLERIARAVAERSAAVSATG